MIKLSIGIPTINRADLLNSALYSYFDDFPDTEIFIVDNGYQNIQKRDKNFQMFKSTKNLGVAESWNMIIKNGFNKGATHVLILNDDIYLGKKTDEIIKFLEENPDGDFYVTKNHWCAFIITKPCFEKVGLFDNKFYPAYFEDNDYCYRMRLAGMKQIKTEFLNPAIFRNSMTIAKNPELNHNFENNRQYYKVKWGGEPAKETYKTPFNQ